jgi:NADPH2:quinone reductase
VNQHAILLHSTGGPEVLQYEEIALGPPSRGEARVRHHAIGVNFVDVYYRSGLYPPLGFPFVPGAEAAGVIEAVGPGVSEFTVGDRVVYASRPLGAYCDVRNMPASRLVALPDDVDFKLGAAVMLKGMTAQFLVRRTFHVERGHTVLVHAAAGGVGSLVCQWAHHLFATVIGVVGTEDKVERAQADGCDHVIVRAKESFQERVREITGGRGVQVVYDSVGRDTFEGSLDSLAPLGMLVSFGQSSGAIPAFEMSRLAKNSLYVTRPSLFDYTAKREDLASGSNELFDMLRKGALRCRIHKQYRLVEAGEAHRDLESRRTSGSSLLIP